MQSKLKKRALPLRILEKVVDILVIAIIVAPILLMITTAFKIERDAFILFPFSPTLANYQLMFGEYNVGGAFLNSIIVAGATTIIVIPIAVMSAFAFSRIRFKAKGLILTYVLACQFLPPVVMAIPYFNMLRTFGLIDTHIALILVNLSTALPYSIWLLLGYVDALPVEIEEAAYVDGCGRIQAMAKVTVPLIMPGIISSAVMCFIVAWNEYLFAVIMSSSKSRTLTVALQQISNSSTGLRWTWMCAIASLVVIPVFFLAFPIRKHFVAGVTMGSDR